MMEKEPFNFALEASDYSKTRRAFLDNFQIPTLKQAKCILGKFADFVYAQCDQGLKHFIKGQTWPPYGDMWISPSDLLIQKFVLKAPPTRQHMDVLTMEGAAMVGWKVEQKLLKFLKKDKAKALDDQYKTIMRNFNETIIKYTTDAKNRERDDCRRKTMELTAGFDMRLQLELKEITHKLQKENEGVTGQEDLKTKREWELRIKTAVEETTKKLTTEFLEVLAAQEELMAINFKSGLTKREIKRKFNINKQDAEFTKTLQTEKHRLECKHITNMMYILCMEKYKCQDEKEAVDHYYKNRIIELSKTISTNKETIEKLKNDIAHQVQELNLRETCILEILKQYQKFISVALKSAPKKANFLLSIEKLLLFELTEALSHIKTKPALNEVMDKANDDKEESSSTSESSDNVLEITEGKKKRQPFVFNRKLYVKERFKEFADLLEETDLEYQPNRHLWGEDVTLLIDALKESVPELKITESRILELKTSVFTQENLRKMLPRKSSMIQFKLSQDSQPYTDLVCVTQVDEPFPLMDKMKTKTPLKYGTYAGRLLSPIDYSKIVTETNTTILGAKSSLEIANEKRTAKPTRSNLHQTKEGVEDLQFKLNSHEDVTHIGNNQKSLEQPKLSTVILLDPEVKSPASGQGTSAPRSEPGMKSPASGQGTSVPRSEPGMKSPASGQRTPVPRSEPGMKSPASGQRTPVPGTKSPASGQRTPVPGIKSPASGKRTPVPRSEPPSSTSIKAQERSELLPMSAKDSLILRQSSLAKQCASFAASPKDSIEVAKDSFTTGLLRQASSKLMTARDSVAYMKEPKPPAVEVIAICTLCHQKEYATNPDKDFCCNRCIKKQSVDFANVTDRKDKIRDEQQRQLKMAKVEVFEMDTVKVHNVVIAPETKPFHPQELEKMYKPSKKIRERRRRPYVDPCKTLFKPLARIEGDPTTYEYKQNNTQFTKDRVRSFITLMGNHPSLIKLFTSCQQ